MQSNSSVDFAKAVRAIGIELRRHGLRAPGFRSPPRLAGVQRSLRRMPNGAVVAVQLKNRPWPAVLADMIEGCVVSNGLSHAQADTVRSALWRAVGVQQPGASAVVSPDRSADRRLRAVA
jgi:hypothetical protein